MMFMFWSFGWLAIAVYFALTDASDVYVTSSVTCSAAWAVGHEIAQVIRRAS